MKKDIIYFFAGPIISSLIISGCTKKNRDSGCLSYQLAPVTKITGPDSGYVNQDISLIVSFGIFNGCGKFGNVEQTQNADTTFIKLNAKYEGCICTQLAGTMDTTFSFRANHAGIYFLKFLQPDQSYLTDTLFIQ
jgi:hypothetical protein